MDQERILEKVVVVGRRLPKVVAEDRDAVRVHCIDVVMAGAKVVNSSYIWPQIADDPLSSIIAEDLSFFRPYVEKMVLAMQARLDRPITVSLNDSSSTKLTLETSSSDFVEMVTSDIVSKA